MVGVRLAGEGCGWMCHPNVLPYMTLMYVVPWSEFPIVPSSPHYPQGCRVRVEHSPHPTHTVGYEGIFGPV